MSSGCDWSKKKFNVSVNNKNYDKIIWNRKKILNRLKNTIWEELTFFWENWNFLIVIGGLIGCIGLWAFWRTCN